MTKLKFRSTHQIKIRRLKRTERLTLFTMTSDPKGLVLIIHLLCSRIAGQTCTDHDVYPLYRLFKEMGFTVEPKHKNEGKPFTCNTGDEFKDFLSNLFEGRYSRSTNPYNSLVIIWLGKGNNEGLYLADGQSIITVKQITEILNGFGYLTGKPKLLCFQACLCPATEMTTDIPQDQLQDEDLMGNLPEFSLKVDRPACDDVVIAVSTLHSHLIPEEPSWFTNSLVEIFSGFALKDDVANLLTFINHELTRKCFFLGNITGIFLP